MLSKNIPNIANTMRVSTQLKTYFGKSGDFPGNKDYSYTDIQISVRLEELPLR